MLHFLQRANQNAAEHAAAQGDATVVAADHHRIAPGKNLDLSAFVEPDPSQMRRPFAVVIERNDPRGRVTRRAGQTMELGLGHIFLRLNLNQRGASGKCVKGG